MDALERDYAMENKKIIAMMLTLSMLAAAFAGCLGGDDEEEPEPEPEWSLTAAPDVNPVWVESGWDPIIPNLNAGEMCDAIISAMTKTEERDQVVDFTRAYYTSSQGVIGGSGSAAISDVSELNAAGTIIGVQSGTTSDLYANENLGDATTTAYEDFPSVIAALNNGDVHYAMGDAPVLSLEGDLMATFSDENFGLAVREDSGELLAALDVAIGAVVASGEYDAIYGAWFDGAVTLADDTTADTATAYPTPTEGSTLTGALESGDLKLCTDPFYPPFESYDADGNVEGFDADMADAIVDEIAAHYMGTDNPMFQAPEPTTTTIKLGFLNDASGPIAQFAAPFTFAWQAAMADLNAMGDDYVFEVIEADSGCDGTMAQTAAQSLIDAGVVAVAGAACSGASMGANALLSAAGIPMISYASTSPALSDATAHPHFYRIVPSDALQGQAVADMIAASGVSNTAVIHMTNSYGAGLADSAAANLGADNVCVQIGYEETATDFQSAVQSVIDEGCDSVFLASYSSDGAMIVETMAVLGAAVPTFSADGMAGEASLEDYTNPAAANGLQVTKPRAAAGGGSTAFTDACAADDICSTGIYQSEAYDTVMMIGHAAMMEDGENMGTHVPMVGSGDGYAGETGTHVFLDNGDVGGSGYDVCTFHHVPTYGEYFNCDRAWAAGAGLLDVDWMGATVKIGFLNDASGPIAVYGPGFVAASQIAIGLANTIGYSNGVQFEIVYADSGCDGTMGATAAQALIDAGVWGAVGAACSGASMGANSLLSAAGIPQVSYASTSPALSDATAYPGFFRVVPSDAFQGSVVADVMTADGMDNVAVIHMTNAYGSGLADAFVANMDASSICTQIGYAEDTTDHSGNVQSIIDAGCTSVMMVSYASDGAAIIEEMASQGYSGAIYGADGIAEEGLAADMTDKSLVDGIIATKPAAAGAPGEVAMTFAYLCSMSPDCAGGIYTAEAFDAVTIVAFAAFTALANPGLDANMAVAGTGQEWNGASGTISFLANGDVPAAGFCIGEFSHDASADTVSYDCTRSWDPVNGITTA